MASIVQKKNRYYVVYLYDSEDGRRKQKWESFKTKEEAKRRKAEMETLEKKDVLCVFPEHTSGTAMVLVLKKPKTLTSTRRIYLPRTVAEMLIGWKRDRNPGRTILRLLVCGRPIRDRGRSQCHLVKPSSPLLPKTQ